MKTVLTGGGGFIGAATLEALSGHEVHVLDKSVPESIRERTAATEGDLSDPETLEKVLEGAEVVIHLAARVGIEQDPAELPLYLRENAENTAVLLTEMRRRGIEKLVLASSMVVYGEGTYHCPEHGRIHPGQRSREALEEGEFEQYCHCGNELEPEITPEDSPLRPASAYALSKLHQEQVAALWTRSGGRAALLRYHNVYGKNLPRNTPYAGVVALWMDRILRGEAPLVFEDGGQLRDFVHVEDVAEANRLALEHLEQMPAGHVRAYNIGSGERRPILEMARTLSALTGGKEPEVTGRWRIEDVRHITASTKRAEEELGYRVEKEYRTRIEELLS